MTHVRLSILLVLEPSIKHFDYYFAVLLLFHYIHVARKLEVWNTTTLYKHFFCLRLQRARKLAMYRRRNSWTASVGVVYVLTHVDT